MLQRPRKTISVPVRPRPGHPTLQVDVVQVIHQRHQDEERAPEAKLRAFLGDGNVLGGETNKKLNKNDLNNELISLRNIF